ncbi:uncharacterized protein J4E84_008746 [Alternaria hordeiaustralica]|uniref:uncharacterized protein n=1 Tax=Alternaria hordeiaustralica TaxID=1187925 RepID=UPI0020C570BE|nr:uncharacterized protein J4E84_008746 [Alternaria hordeiaustralica]KAI4678490.1 hypothetical protein J4E84_008746 [Alternaria hordeiaustralica]
MGRIRHREQREEAHLSQLGRKQEPRARVKVEPESPDNTVYPTTPASRRRDYREETKVVKPGGPSSRHHTVHIKVEDKADLETPPHYPSFTTAWSKSPLRVPTPLAEQFYRSTVVKKESDVSLVHRDVLSLRSQTSGPSVSSSYKRFAVETFRDFDASHPASKVKIEEEPEKGYYIPTGASKVKHEAASSSSNVHHRRHTPTNYAGSYYKAPVKEDPASHSSPDLRRTRSHCAVAPTPELRSETKFSYLQPITPTPFSTPYGLVNPYPPDPSSYLVPGSLIEGVQRRTKWGQRDRRTKRQPPALQPRGAPVTEGVASDKQNATKAGAEGTGSGGKCAWYKLSLCKCSKWISCIKAKCERAAKEKWWQSSKQHQYTTERREDSGFYVVRREIGPNLRVTVRDV